jgi:lysyl-tRNA synthetase class 2
MDNWQPSAPLQNLQLRATALTQIREFFRRRQVMEVDTPLLSIATVTDPHLHSITVPQVFAGTGPAHYLQTSPEFAMKRLLAAGSGAIYQLGKAFRFDESGTRHSPEFTMLEWYRPGFDEWQLMDEVELLVRELQGGDAISRISYRELFLRYLDIDPFIVSQADLFALVRTRLELHTTNYNRDDLLQVLLAQVIEPALQENCFVYHFPASMAALARLDQDESGNAVARRFELFMQGMEIANGYFELTDAAEQRRRFALDNEQRASMNLPAMPVDRCLLAALEQGLPDCAGVALGVDRLLMLMAETDRINDVMSFPVRKPD